MATNEDGNGGDDSTSGPPAASSWEPTCKVTPERIYTVALHPDPRQFLVAAGDKSGVLGFWNIGSTDQFTSASQKTPDEAVKSVSMADMTTADVFSFRPHTATLTQLLYNKRDATKLYTSSYDGSIRCLDLIHQTFTEACVTETGDRFITGFDNDPGTGQLLYYTTSDGTLGFHDLRTPATDITAWQLQERKIGGMHLNPVEPQYLVTASLDRTMRVWDLRWMVQLSPGTDDPVEVSTFDYPKSVTAAYWDPTGNHIVNTNFDDTIRLSTMDWSSAPDSSSSLTATGDSNAKGGSPNLRERFVIRHNNQTGRWLTMFRAQWHPDPTMPPCFVVGNMKRYVDIFCGSTGELVTQLYDPDRITAVPAVNVFHAHLPVVVSANASGRMVVWS
ncbi:WD40-repeat-containing domain protein [Dimargaris cristalligena]|uniref:DNA damage-binding protein CMR1 n=1 Tax=Dimargaris cristalligena TaxID=215637 RepID=A0A4V1J562_9FUNG|nr:WD40-repeat-containing domain protein [Dimargaris cristalligena]|eukprot:RKP37949.1 WD40-repeat-containing domain protein [Dimargaris cristalligena]